MPLSSSSTALVLSSRIATHLHRRKEPSISRKIRRVSHKALDRIGSLYYTQEGYDDFYYGRVPPSPTCGGAIGILFEQASSRGHLTKPPAAYSGFLLPHVTSLQRRSTHANRRALPHAKSCSTTSGFFDDRAR